MASTSSDSRDIRQYKVPTSVFKRVFDLSRLEFKGSEQLGWRKFYEEFKPFEAVTRTSKVNKKTINFMARHSRRKGKKWCQTSFNFVARIPIDPNSSEVIFRLLTCNLDKCNCRKLSFYDYCKLLTFMCLISRNWRRRTTAWEGVPTQRWRGRVHRWEYSIRRPSEVWQRHWNRNKWISHRSSPRLLWNIM